MLPQMRTSILFLAAVWTVGCGQAPAPVPAPAPSPKPPDEKVDATPPIVVSAQALYDASRDSEALAKYNGKVVEVTGQIVHFSLNTFDTTSLDSLYWFAAEGKTLGTAAIVRGTEGWKKLLPGQTATVRGKCQSGTVVVSEIVEVKGASAPTLNVAELLEAAKDPKKATRIEKSFQKLVLVEAKIEALNNANELKMIHQIEFSADVLLTPAGQKPRVVAETKTMMEKPPSVGQKATILGIFEAGDEGPKLKSAQLLAVQ